MDATGDLYITSNARIRKVDAMTGIISTIAGNGNPGFSGDGGLATLASINGAQSIAVDGATLIAGGVSPGEIITIFGGPGVILGPATPVGLQLNSSGLTVTVH